jgi:hypothetical protein
MKQTCRYVLFLMTLLTTAQCAVAQTDARQEARSVFRQYEINPVLSFKAVIKMYPAGRPEKLIDKVNAEYVLQKEQYYCKIANVEIIRNEQGSYIIDHDDKVVLQGKYNSNSQKKSKQEEAAFNLQSVFAQIQLDSLQFAVTAQGGLRKLNITGMADPRILKYQVIYDPASYLVKQLLIEMKPEDARYGQGNILVDITYNQYARTPKPSGFFSEKKYLTGNGKKATLQPAYKSYQLVNQL